MTCYKNNDNKSDYFPCCSVIPFVYLTLLVVISVYFRCPMCNYILRRHQAYLGLGLFVARLFSYARKFGKAEILP
jgi:hypothetical protein